MFYKSTQYEFIGFVHILKMRHVRVKQYNNRKIAKFTTIWTGLYQTYAVEKESGDIFAWGLNGDSELVRFEALETQD